MQREKIDHRAIVAARSAFEPQITKLAEFLSNDRTFQEKAAAVHEATQKLHKAKVDLVNYVGTCV